MMTNKFKAWAWWAKQDVLRLQPVSSFLLLMRGNVNLNRNKAYEITDDEAMQIDKAVAQLAKHSIVLWHVFQLYYVYEWSLRKIAKDYLTPLEYPMQKHQENRKQVCHKRAGQMLLLAEQYLQNIYKNI